MRRGLISLQSGLRSGRSLLDLLNSPVQELSLDEFNRKKAEFQRVMADAEQAAEDIGNAFNGPSANADVDRQLEELIDGLRDVSAAAGNARLRR